MHWRIEGKRSWGTSFCEDIYSVEGCKGEECCCKGKIIIHKNAAESIIGHRGVNYGKSTIKGDGYGAAWCESDNEEMTRNLGQNYTFEGIKITKLEQFMWT